MKKRVTLVILGLGISLLIACLGVWLVAATSGTTRLMSIDGVTTVATNCLTANNKVRPGTTVKLYTTWRTERDLVGVIGDYQGLGYSPISSYTKSIEMLPGAAQTYNLLILQVRLQRAISLSYTSDLATRIQAITSLTVCPP